MATATAAKKTAVKKPARPSGGAPKAAPKASKKAVAGSVGGFAVIMTGGKQYRVSAGQKLKIEKMLGPSTSSGQASYKEGDTIVFKEVLMKDDGAESATIGTPTIAGASVSATLSKISRYKTVDVIHYKQKSRYFKKYGHRQPYFEVTIDSIN